MYDVSNAYLAAMQEPIQKYKLRITIGSPGRRISEADILAGSFTIKNQCSDTDIVQIGSVYAAELKMTIRPGVVERSTWDGMKIEVEEGMLVEIDPEQTPAEIYEYVPLGVFYVAEANHSESGVSITAYDNMLKFDKTWGISTTIGSPYDVLRMLCNDCRVTLGLTKAQVEALPNGTASIALYSENDCQTYRDVLFWLAQFLACFATIDRSGKLVLRQYTANISDEISAAFRYKGATFSDFVTEYSGLGFTDIATQEYIYIGDQDPTLDNKLTYNLGANPWLQYGTMSTRKTYANQILNALKVIVYTPFRASYLNTPAYDLGDVIHNSGGISGSALSCIMSYEYSFKNRYTAEGFGKNPALATAADKVDKDIAGLMSRTDKNGVQFYTFKNAEEKTIGDGEQEELIYIRFTTMDARQVTFQAEILADAEATVDEVVAQIDYYLDGAVVANYQPTETWTEDGKHIISLYYMIDVEPNRLYQWGVRLTADGGTITIPQGNARGTVWGQGLVAVGAWGGFIDVEDTIAEIPLDSITVATFTEICSAEAQIPIAVEIAQQLTDITLDSIDVSEFEDYVLVNKSSLYFSGMTWGDVKEYIWEEIKDYFAW